MSAFLFKNRDGQTPLPVELRKGLKLKNIQTVGELDEYEEQSIARGLIWLETQSPLKVLDRYFWFEIHKRLFSDVWSWAGKVRSHELLNPDFVEHANVHIELKKLEEHLGYWIENKIYKPRLLVTRFHERLLTIHPFPNGNGRFSRITCEKLAEHLLVQQPSWGVSYKEEAQKRRDHYIDSVELARKDKNYKPLEDFIFN